MQKKSQAAMEFLMTYGWAILISTIVIGILATWGILNYKQIVPSRCIGDINLPCIKKPIVLSSEDAGKSKFSFVVRNPMPEQLILNSIETEDLRICNISYYSINVDGTTKLLEGAGIKSGDVFTINVYCNNALSGIADIEFSLEYSTGNSDFFKSAGYEIIASAYKATLEDVVLPE